MEYVTSFVIGAALGVVLCFGAILVASDIYMKAGSEACVYHTGADNCVRAWVPE